MNPESIESQFREWFGSDVGVSAASIQGEKDLFAEEQTCAGAVPKRRMEFATGRWCARQALAQLSLPAQAIPVGALRGPVWPAGVCGSITHDGGISVAVAGRTVHHLGLGIDILETARALPILESAGSILDAPGEDSMPATQYAVDTRVLRFSAKESAIKAVSERMGRWVDFTEISVRFEPSSFRVVVSRYPEHITGRWAPGRRVSSDGRVALKAPKIACRRPFVFKFDQRVQVQELNVKDRRLSDEFVSQTGRTLLNLRELLLRGEFRPGERISELPLVARLGVSRTPIRLALDRLANEGLLEAAPSGGFVVREFTRTDIWDAIEVRGVLEGTAARLASERLVDDSELDVLRSLQTQMDSIQHPTIDTFARYIDLNEAFHSALLDLAKSPMLRRALEKVMSLPFAAPSALVFARTKLPRAAEMFTIAGAHHRSLLEAVANRQGARAENLAREHALLSRRNLEMVFSDESLLSSLPGGSLIKPSGE